MALLPTIDFCGHQVTRFISGGNTMSGFSHFSPELDRDLVAYYTMPNIQKHWQACAHNGINTIQTRGDRHMIRAFLEHRETGGQLQWIVQTASELRDLQANIRGIAGAGAMAIYIHGTFTDNHWHAGTLDEVNDLVKTVKDAGLPAGVGTHIPEVLEEIESRGWDTDFYMGCFYNLARKTKVEVAKGETEKEEFDAGDPALMAAVLRQIPKPCIAFKIMAASRNCGSEDSIRQAFEFAYANIKDDDIVNVGMFQKYKDQVAENAAIARDILQSS